MTHIVKSIEELETLPPGTAPRTSHYRLEERESARQPSLKGRGRALVSQTNTETVSKATDETYGRRGDEHVGFFSERMN